MPRRRSLARPEPEQLTTRADLAVARLAAGQWGVLSVAELRACGLSADAILTRVRRGNLHPLHRGVYAVGHRNITTEGRFLAAVEDHVLAALTPEQRESLYDLLQLAANGDVSCSEPLDC